jgi:RNA polymerase sigma factor (TIGR02999 family)
MNGIPAGSTPDSITELIERANDGDKDALNRLFAGLYAELHALARSRVHRNTPITLLDTTVLLHEYYLRLTKLGALKVTSRAHFLAYAARAMRSIIVDYGRQRLAERRGGGALEVPLDTESDQPIASGEEEVLRVHEALEELATVDERVVRVVEMRYFGGLTEEEIAEALGVTTRTVQRDWEKARLLLSIALK